MKAYTLDLRMEQHVCATLTDLCWQDVSYDASIAGRVRNSITFL